MGKTKTGKNRLDKFYHLAKEQGYRSRAVFKLLQLNAMFRFLPTAQSVLDLCAAPGGWLQAAVRHAPVGSFILGVDLVPIRPIRGAHTIAEDITTPRCRAAIKRLMDSNGVAAFDVVLHDGSPNVGAAWGKDATMQSALVVDSIRLATSFLAPKGIFLTKVFRSQDYSAIIFCLKQLFEKVEVTKPLASRSTSAEIYVIGQRYKAPAKIDPRLLDVKHLFQASTEQPKVIDVLRGTKQKRNREGYEDGITTLWKVGKVSDFIWSDSPLEFLGSVNALSFEDSSSLSVKEHDLTTDEIKSLCEDLYVLDKNSFKHLLRWRMRIRKVLSSSDKDASKVANVKKDVKGNEDERLLVEMEELTHALERKKKKAKKVLEKRRAKDKARKALGIQIDATEDSYFDKQLFSLAAIKGKKNLQTIESASDEDGELGGSESEAETHAAADCSSDLDSDEEQRRYDEQVEEMLDEVYERYLNRKGGSTKQRKRAKRDLSIGDAELMENADGEDIAMDPESDQDQDEKEANPLVVPLNEDDQPTGEQIMEQWFSQDVFVAAVEAGVLNVNYSEDEKDVLPKILKNAKVPKGPSPPKILKNAKVAKGPSPKILKNAKVPKGPSPPQSQKAKNQEDFEIVPEERMDTSDDSSSDEESEEDDDDTKAEILALAKKMLRKKQREEIIDAAYNKYTNDDVGLPKWFVEDEKRHCRRTKFVTKEEVAEMKAQLRKIDARPAKKVAEAKARKKRAAMRKIEKARKKADTISNQTDISERSKNKMIDHLYKKAMPTRPKKEYVVAKKGVAVKGGKGKVIVDRRMKKDKRTKGMGRPGRGGRSAFKGNGPKAKGKGPKGKPFGKKAGKGGKKRNKGGIDD